MKTLFVWLTSLSMAFLAGCTTHETVATDQDRLRSAAGEIASVADPSNYFRPAAISKIDASAWEVSSIDHAVLDRLELQLLNLGERIRQIEVRAFEKLQKRMRDLAKEKGMLATA